MKVIENFMFFLEGETKGKEVELEQILSLNQDLAPVNENGNKIGKVIQSTNRKFELKIKTGFEFTKTFLNNR